MITDRDIKKMKTIFATKDDLKQYASKKDLRSMEGRIINKFNEVVDYFDDRIINHEKRITNLEINHTSL